MDVNKLMADIADIKNHILRTHICICLGPYESNEINAIGGALAQAQGEMHTAAAKSVNPFFKSKYASFTEIVIASRNSLAKNKISVVQKIIFCEKHGSSIQTKLIHESGQWVSSIMQVSPQKEDIHSKGSYISYVKRYSYAALVGVCTEDEDDDGNAASQQERKQSSRPLLIQKEYEKVTSEQVQNLMFEIGEHTDIAESLLKNFNITKIADMPKDYYIKVLQKIRANVASRKTQKAKE